MERISANLLGPDVVRARPPNPTYLTTKAAQMLETLEARLAAQSEAFFPELRPAITYGPRSFPTSRLPSTTKPPKVYRSNLLWKRLSQAMERDYMPIFLW